MASDGVTTQVKRWCAKAKERASIEEDMTQQKLRLLSLNTELDNLAIDITKPLCNHGSYIVDDDIIEVTKDGIFLKKAKGVTRCSTNS